MTITPQNIITAAAVLAAIITIFKYYNKIYDLVKHQQDQDKNIEAIKKEQTLVVYGVLACLKGMHEQGANGPVNEAIDKIEKHINLAAHDQL